jgi:hypothetical protein
MAVKDEAGLVEKVTDAIVDKDNARELDQKAPGSAFAIVGLTYPFILAVVLLALAAFLWMR